MKRFAGVFALTSTIAAVIPAIANAAVLGGHCGSGPLSFLIPFC